MADETLEYLILYRWPGNVRQLANELRRMMALTEPGAVLMPAHLSAEIVASRRTVPAGRPVTAENEVLARIDQPLAAAVEHLERAAIQRALEEADAVITSGNLSTTIAPLLQGKPVLALPSLLEQYINARRLELLGAGLSAPVQRPGRTLRPNLNSGGSNGQPA